ncbi:MAG: hypothetical protein IPI67_40250 [Myxococcales bacterium]|nr:hypothetical protein [Myxococcales bacterium]
MQRQSVAVVLASLVLGAGCGAPVDSDETVGEISEAVVAAPLGAAYCEIPVTGKGVKALEDDYLPHVITCENGGAGLEALKAQAIAARSVAYYSMATKGSICDGQGCQVYSCGAAPQAKHFQAVKETAGQYLSFAGALTYGFYVAGDTNTGGPSCHGSGGSTEGYVTYNFGKTGGAVKQTSLGYVGPPGFGQNRGCMGQWGARCLEKSGWGFMDILRFYYGSDISVLKANGACTGGCEPTACNGSKIVSPCGTGDCAVYGATCVNDSKGVRCASVFCPAIGQKKVCVNDKLIGDCNDGGISTGDCSVYGAACVDDSAGARCVSVFCADKPQKAHDVCLPNGQLAHCTNLGGISAEDCPASKPCTQTATGAECGAPKPPAGGGGGGAGGASGSGGASGGEAGEAGAAGAAGDFGSGGALQGGGGVATGSGGSGQKTKVIGGDDASGCATTPMRGSAPGAAPLFSLLGLWLMARRSARRNDR